MDPGLVLQVHATVPSELAYLSDADKLASYIFRRNLHECSSPHRSFSGNLMTAFVVSCSCDAMLPIPVWCLDQSAIILSRDSYINLP